MSDQMDGRLPDDGEVTPPIPETSMTEPEPGSAAQPEPEPAPEPAPAPKPAPEPTPTVTVFDSVPTPERRPRGVRTGGVLFGLTLVLVGVYALTGGINSVLDLLRLWPLLIILGGLMRIFSGRGDSTVKRVAEGLGSVGFGLVLLGNTLGTLPWNVWFAIVSLWPLLLVAFGVELVGRGMHQDWVRALSNVVLLLGLGYAVFVVQPGIGPMPTPFVSAPGPSSAFAASMPHDAEAPFGTVDIKVGATNLTVKSGSDLVSMSGHAPESAKPHLSSSVTPSDAVVTIEAPSDTFVFGVSEKRDLTVALDSAMTWDRIRLDVGAVTADADLSGLTVKLVELNVGASDARIKIGRLAPKVKVDVSGGATSVTVLVPADAAVTLNSTSGLSSIRVPSSFKLAHGIGFIGNSTYTTSGSGGPDIVLDLSSGVSDLRIQTY